MSEDLKINTKLKKDDVVVVIAGKEKGKTGRILRIDTKVGRVLVEGINMVKKAKKKKSQQDQGGIIDIEATIDISNVQLMDKSGKPTRIKIKEEGGKRIRVAARTGEAL